MNGEKIREKSKNRIIVNGLLIVVSGFIFGLNSAIYAVISLLISSYVIRYSNNNFIYNIR